MEEMVLSASLAVSLSHEPMTGELTPLAHAEEDGMDSAESSVSDRLSGLSGELTTVHPHRDEEGDGPAELVREDSLEDVSLFKWGMDRSGHRRSRACTSGMQSWT